MYLIFDTSANGKPKKWSAPANDTFNWPRLIHLSWIRLDENLKPIDHKNRIIKPTGFEILEETRSHSGISAEKAEAEGKELKEVLKEFKSYIDQSEIILSHNHRFNESVLAAEYVRSNMDHNLFNSESYCLMQECTYYCKIPGKMGNYKWPSLPEVHIALFNQSYPQPGHARADVLAAARCFIKLMQQDALDI